MKQIFEWCVKRKWVIAFNLGSFILFGIVAEKYNERQTKIENEIAEIKRQAEHDKETDFALRLTGMRKTAEVTEQGMIDHYTRNLELIEHCKKVGTCQLTPTLAVIKPLPSYVPVAAIYLEEKQKLIDKSKEK